MSKTTAKWEANARGLAKRVIQEDKVPAELLQGILSKDDKTRYTSFKTLMFVGDEHPELLYSHWNDFAILLDSDNTNSKYIASYLIASLVPADTDGKFEKIFDKYYGLLDDKSVIPAAHVARNSGKIVRKRPQLESKITTTLLSIDRTHHNLSHKELIKSEAIGAFNEYFETAKDKRKILDFVRQQLGSKSPKNRKMAKEFFKRWVNAAGNEEQKER